MIRHGLDSESTLTDGHCLQTLCATSILRTWHLAPLLVPYTKVAFERLLWRAIFRRTESDVFQAWKNLRKIKSRLHLHLLLTHFCTGWKMVILVFQVFIYCIKHFPCVSVLCFTVCWVMDLNKPLTFVTIHHLSYRQYTMTRKCFLLWQSTLKNAL